jgi:hypothetical protein
MDLWKNESFREKKNENSSKKPTRSLPIGKMGKLLKFE